MKILCAALFYCVLGWSPQTIYAGVLEAQDSGIICERIESTLDVAVLSLNKRIQRYEEEQSRLGLGTIMGGTRRYLALTSLQYIKTENRDYACVLFEKKPEK